MRLVLVTLPVAMLLLGPSSGSAQPLQSFHDLALGVNLGDRLQIKDQSGAVTSGRLTRLTRDDITIQTDAGETRFASTKIREVAVRRHSPRTGVLIGAGVGAGLSALAACTGPERTECADGAILGGAFGAGVGLAFTALFPRTTIVYRAPIDAAPSRESASPAGPFDDLALRVNFGDRLRVEEWSGARVTGRLTRLAGDELTLDTDAGDRSLTSATVREVAVRGHSLRTGALVGAGVFAALAFAAPACRSNPDCTPIGAAAVGAGAGLALGALIPHMTTVFRAPQKRPTFSAQLSRGIIAIRANLCW